ncbi:MAG: DNA polymerase III subunit beta [Chitinispirillia bacterium]|nr:DNA polymerase III subunit beta [Chitinispirillia bacterium]MCL2268513.1 DNA polymerase III subunit beta [Chitinispirillia bacterium]
MSVLIQKKDLCEAMQKAIPVVPNKTALLILSNFKLSYSDSELEIMATDADHSLRVTAPASGDGNLEITVNARKILDQVKELPEGELKLYLDGLVLIMETERGLYKIAGAAPDDFPGIPTVENGVELDMGIFALRDMIQKSAFAVAKDETRIFLSGVLWELSSDKAGMVATDGHRLGYSFIGMNLPVNDTISKIVSHKSVQMLLRITDAKSQDEQLKVVIGDKYVSFSTQAFTMVSRLVEGQYPDYNKVIPKNNPKIVIADRVALLDVVRRVAVLASQKSHLIHLRFKEGAMEATVMNREIGGEAREVIDVQYTGEEHLMGINGQFLSEVLGIVGTKNVRLEMNTQISACLIFPEYNDEKDKISDDLFLLMPLRIMDDI